MNVIHLSNSLSVGGAAIACSRLHHAMQTEDIESSVLTADLSFRKDWKGTVLKNVRQNLITITQRFDLERISTASGIWSSGYGFFSEYNLPELKNADIIYLHWVNAGFLSIPEIGRILSLGKPVFWVLHDMWPITGGCHYSFECKKYQEHCRNCFLLKSSHAHDKSYRIFQQKLKYFASRSNLHIITPSRWLGDCSKQSALFAGNSVSVIPNPIDSSVFFPIEKCIIRKILGIPERKKVLLFGAFGGFSNPYKGWQYLQKALEKVDMSDKILLIFGSEPDEKTAHSIQGEVRFLGKVQPDWAMNLVYNSADVFIVPSLADNFPNVIAESMLAGVPCAAFGVGGIFDLIRHKENGYLAQYKDPDDLAAGIEWILNYPDPAELSANAVMHIRQLCNPEKIVQMHRELWSNSCFFQS